MADYIEGKHPVIEALRAQMPLRCVLMADTLKRDGQVADILRKANKYNVPVKRVSRKELDAKSERGSHQGVMAEALPFKYASMTDIVKASADHAKENNNAALVIVLDHITDAGNLGAIARSAEVVGASGLIIPNKRSAQVTAATYKSSAGAINHLPVAQVANLTGALDRLKKAGFWVAGASEHAQHTVWEAPLYGKIALVMGNEQEGISRLTLESCDFLVKLPQAGMVGSLNVAQASTAVMYEWLRQVTNNVAEKTE
jgi:23S rRNA (guanosine2251-2'-O)-methyltransferase